MDSLDAGKCCSKSSDGAWILGDASSSTTTNNDEPAEQRRRRRRRREEEKRQRWREQEASLETEWILYQLKEIKGRLEDDNLRSLHETVRHLF